MKIALSVFLVTSWFLAPAVRDLDTLVWLGVGLLLAAWVTLAASEEIQEWRQDREYKRLRHRRYDSLRGTRRSGSSTSFANTIGTVWQRSGLSDASLDIGPTRLVPGRTGFSKSKPQSTPTDTLISGNDGVILSEIPSTPGTSISEPDTAGPPGPVTDEA